jgi:hypothetical protein
LQRTAGYEVVIQGFRRQSYITTHTTTLARSNVANPQYVSTEVR